ncbi:MAG: MBL fold metallo-hydrolase [Pseudomonadota bacterium]|nr:MBL fold metallo-hydrolase [Pseudomonadota bacterium]
MKLNFRAVILVLAAAMIVTGCSSMKPYSGSPQFNAAKNTFQHPRGYRHDKGLLDVLGLARAYFGRDEDPAETEGFPLLDPAVLPPPAGNGPHITWVGHSTLLFTYRGVSVLTDPMFSDRASPFGFIGPKRVVPPAYTAESLPPVDVAVISHAHYDHLDLPGLRRLAARQPDIRFIVPLGLARYVRRAGFEDVVEIDWWQSDTRDDVTVTATPLRHWASRTPFDRNKTLWSGFMIRFADGYRFYFAGDTGYGADFVETRERLGAPDFAAIPIGAYEPRDFMRESHSNPEEAVQIFEDLGAGHAVAVHWGTFKLTLEPLAEPPQRLVAALAAAGIASARFRALQHGERWDL